MRYTERFIEIDAPVERVFDLFSNFENFPRWMRNIKDVHYSGPHYTRWTAAAPLGSEVEWEAETTLFEPDHKIAWRSVRGDVDTDGEVIFEETRRGTTLMHVVLGYHLPAGRLGEMVASLFDKNPAQELEDDLERFAAVAEGRRHIRPSRDTADRREKDTEEKPPRTSRGGRRNVRGTGAYIYDGKDVRPFAHGEGYAHDKKDSERDDKDSQHERQESSRRRFDDELRAARRSQLEGVRRYREARERDERYRDEPRREERSYRYALTPRERERERATRREPDDGYRAFGRGVDRLLDNDPPSRRWRR